MPIPCYSFVEILWTDSFHVIYIVWLILCTWMCACMFVHFLYFFADPGEHAQFSPFCYSNSVSPGVPCERVMFQIHGFRKQFFHTIQWPAILDNWFCLCIRSSIYYSTYLRVWIKWRFCCNAVWFALCFSGVRFLGQFRVVNKIWSQNYPSGWT